MDGLQRISTIIDSFAAKFELDGLEIWSDLNGRKCSKLLEKIKDGIDRMRNPVKTHTQTGVCCTVGREKTLVKIL